MSKQHWSGGRGPFRSDQVRSGDPYELSQGHPVVCAPTGHEGAGPNGLGFAVLDSDPAVKRAGVDAGLALGPDTLRAPDVAVNYTAGEGTWATAAPLVVEYAGGGQDEVDLREKIVEYHGAGTRWVWVVRLVGERRVEVHERGESVRVVGADGELTAPGVLALPVPVRALFDRDVAHETTLRNILSAKGYESLDAVRKEGMDTGRKEGLDAGRKEGLDAGRKEGLDAGRKEGLDAGTLAARRAVLFLLLEAAAIEPTADDRAQVERCEEAAAIDAWILRTRAARSRAEVFDAAG